MSGCLNVSESPPGLTDQANLKRPSFHLNIKQGVMAQVQKYRTTHFLIAGKKLRKKR